MDLIIPVLGFKYGLKYDWTERRKVLTFGVSYGKKEIFRATDQVLRQRKEPFSKEVGFNFQMSSQKGTFVLIYDCFLLVLGSKARPTI